MPDYLPEDTGADKTDDKVLTLSICISHSCVALSRHHTCTYIAKYCTLDEVLGIWDLVFCMSTLFAGVVAGGGEEWCSGGRWRVVWWSQEIPLRHLLLVAEPATLL